MFFFFFKIKKTSRFSPQQTKPDPLGIRGALIFLERPEANKASATASLASRRGRLVRGDRWAVGSVGSLCFWKKNGLFFFFVFFFLEMLLELFVGFGKAVGEKNKLVEGGFLPNSNDICGFSMAVFSLKLRDVLVPCSFSVL